MLNMTLKEKPKEEYRVDLASRRVEKELDKVPDKIYSRVSKAIHKLGGNPRPTGVKKLAQGRYRLRVGSYRIIYSVFDKEKLVIIDKIDRRKERTYKGLGHYSYPIAN